MLLFARFKNEEPLKNGWIFVERVPVKRKDAILQRFLVWIGGVARLTRLPVTEKIAGSNPVRSARTTSYRSDP